MEIKVRKHSGYHEFKLVDGSTTIDSGLLNEQERKEFARIFLEAASELLEGLEDEQA